MSIIKSIITFGFWPSLHVQSSHRSETRTSMYSSSSFATNFKNHDQTIFWDNNMRVKKNYRSKRRFLVRSVVQPGVPPPSEPPFNLINWIVGVAITIVLPFFSHKWASILKIKSEVDTAVEIAEEIVEAVEKVAEGVEKAAEDIAEDLPEGGGLRKAVDFVEHVAERANKDAHIVGDFIDKVQEVEEKVEDYVEFLAEEATNHNHKQPKEEENREPKEGEDRAEEPQEENIDDTHKH